MTTFKIAATVIAAAVSGQGHYEWRQVPQSGPRASLQGARRVWVPDAKQLASCDSDMVKMSGTAAAACMKGMPGMPSPSDASAS